MIHLVDGLMGIVMRGQDDRAEGMFSYIRLEERVPADHPLRAIRALADEVLAGLLALRQVKTLLSADHFPVDGTLPETWD